MTTRVRRVSLLLSALFLFVAVAAPALANQPAERFTQDVTGDEFVCDDAIYTITSGEIRGVLHEGESASGNLNFTVTVVPRKVVAEDAAGNEVRIVGAFWAGATFNTQTGVFQTTVTEKFQLVGKGAGTVDSVNVTFHITNHDNNFVLKDFDFGTCALPEEE